MSSPDVSVRGAQRNGGPRRVNPIDVHVGSRLRLRRMLLDISQEKLGDQLGLTFQQIQKYEKGMNRIGASRLFELSRILGVGVDFFYEDMDEAGPPAKATVGGFADEAECDVVGFMKSREGIELNRAFSAISDAKVRRSVIDLVRSLSIQDGAVDDTV
ncbi:MAG: helix-turn-helix transcriptional regulator [Pseudomonadota bacterium]